SAPSAGERRLPEVVRKPGKGQGGVCPKEEDIHVARRHEAAVDHLDIEFEILIGLRARVPESPCRTLPIPELDGTSLELDVVRASRSEGDLADSVLRRIGPWHIDSYIGAAPPGDKAGFRVIRLVELGRIGKTCWICIDNRMLWVGLARGRGVGGAIEHVVPDE